MAATTEMPYFIKPSINLTEVQKKAAYQKASQEIAAVLHNVTDVMVKMVTINCILKSNLPYFYWTGFYLLKNNRLSVGPYQGTLGCLYIELGKGVCGDVAQHKITKIVSDVHQLQEGKEHISCDPNSKSEIVVPVFNSQKELIAVFDVDSTLKNSFNKTDKQYLEQIMYQTFAV